jgi:hypothetical protein
MAKACLRDGSPFGVCLIRDGAEVGAPAVPSEVGTLARIATWDMPQLGLLQVTARRAALHPQPPRAAGPARASVELLGEHPTPRSRKPRPA